MISRLILILSLITAVNAPAAQKTEAATAAVQKVSKEKQSAYQEPLLKVKKITELFKRTHAHGLVKTITLKNGLDELLGLINYSVEYTNQQNQVIKGTIDVLEVTKEFRHCNYGRFLVTEAVKDLRSHACPTIELFACPTEPNDYRSAEYQEALKKLIAFYQHQDFTVVGYEHRHHIPCGALMRYAPPAQPA